MAKHYDNVGISAIRALHELNYDVHSASASYFHSQPVATSASSIILPQKKQKYGFDIIYDIKDLLVIGAITEKPVILTGGTDTGKTTLAKLVMDGLFAGEDKEKGWHRIDIDLDFGKDAYTDTHSDFFHESGKTTKDLYSIQDWLLLPGLIADELNRAHAKVAGKTLHIIKEKEIALPDGRREKVGYKLPDGTTYQFQIATINEGNEYAGVFEMDKALRRRVTIEIPMDNFPLMPRDRLMLQNHEGANLAPSSGGKNNLEKVLMINSAIKKGLPIHPDAELFILYLGAFDYCQYSITKNKSSVEARQGSLNHICYKAPELPDSSANEILKKTSIQCEFLKEFGNGSYQLCPYVRGITPGINKDLISVASGFAFLRATKFMEMLALYEEDTSKNLSYRLMGSPEKFTSSLKEYVGKPLRGKELIAAVRDKYVGSLEVELGDIESALCFVGFSKMGISPLFVSKNFQGNNMAAIEDFLRAAKSKFIAGQLLLEDVDIGKIMREGFPSDTAAKNIKTKCMRENPWFWRALEAYFKQEGVSQNINLNEIYGD